MAQIPGLGTLRLPREVHEAQATLDAMRGLLLDIRDVQLHQLDMLGRIANRGATRCEECGSTAAPRIHYAHCSKAGKR